MPPALSPSSTQPSTPSPSPAPGGDPQVDVEAVTVSGDPGAYTFAVTLASDETGCDQYADWWEVLGADGSLLFRRILDHSHPSEQPFTRSGAPVEVSSEQQLVVRGHLHPRGYVGGALSGSVAAGFAPVDLEPGFADDVEQAAPQPDGCLF
ncbi:MAG TPA: hypothetical protein ENK18_28080 [Deltaproteobacteria bacterium]|nr:hypothetical protein [Deltaproteobacteria bacterium]